MSGDITLRRPRSKEWQEEHYLANSKLLGFNVLTSEERREAFKRVSVEELVTKLPMFQHWSPTIDGEFIEQAVDLGMLSDPSTPVGKPDWCQEILIGSTHHDVRFLMFLTCIEVKA
jgi:hypothetical protein